MDRPRAGVSGEAKELLLSSLFVKNSPIRNYRGRFYVESAERNAELLLLVEISRIEIFAGDFKCGGPRAAML